MNSGNEAELWKHKYETLEKDFDELNASLRKALQDYTDLSSEHELQKNQCDILKQKLIDAESKLSSLENVLAPACEEFSQLHDKYELERKCRTEAENVASKFYRQNQDLKRQSQLLLEKFDTSSLPAAELGAIFENDADGSFHKQRDSRIIELQQQVADLEQKLEQSADVQMTGLQREKLQETECAHLREELIACQQSVLKYKTAYEQLQKVSKMACQEYEDLKQKYEVEMALNADAVAYAHKMLTERDAMKRQSSILLASVASDEQLMDALMQIEKLTLLHANKVKELEETIRVSRTDDLEKKLEAVTSELETCQKAYKELEKWKEKLEQENLSLIDQLDVARRKLEPPAPPPPPPLPPPPVILRPLKTFVTKKKMNQVDGKVPGTKEQNNENYEQALKEMMDRIKRGQTLRPARLKASNSEAKSDAKAVAFSELQNMLSKFKRDPSPLTSSPETSPED